MGGWGHRSNVVLRNFLDRVMRGHRFSLHALFFIRIIFIRIIRLRSGKNKNNLRIIKAQILPTDELKSNKTGPELKETGSNHKKRSFVVFFP